MADLPSRFGPYQIISPLGAGGMGQVYRARDTRLQRFVAVKILHDAAALDPERQRRFAQEAIAASALNHPNILTVYDVGAEGDVQFIVSELIEGESLRIEMNRGRLPLKRVIDVAHQVAEGLAAAHEAGIIHRDLKPENVMVRSDGRVKIVDFGLAKRPETAAAADAPSSTQTGTGLIVGTVPYMSPEQARGGQADFRSDQFALGVILYEMATSMHPFKRDSAVQTMSAIITDDPPDPAHATPPLPVSVRWLLRRLLAKNPRERFANTADLASDLRTMREYLTEATSVAASPEVLRRPRWSFPTALAGWAAAAGALLLWVLAPGQSGVGFDRFRPLATDAGYQGNAAWAPDGKQIAYEAELNGVVQIFTRTLGSATRTKVTESRFDCYGPTWTEDGYIYYHSLARDKDSLWRVSPVGGAPEMVVAGATRSAVSPDGKKVFFVRQESASEFNMTLWVASPPDAEPRRYSLGDFKGLTISDARVRFSRDGAKVMIWLDSGRRAAFWEVIWPDREPRRVLSPLSESSRVPPLFDWLPDGRHLVVARSDAGTTGTHLWLADTATDRFVSLTATPGNETGPSVSPDGRAILFSADATDFDLFEVPLDGAPLRPFLSSTRNEYDPAASPVNTQFAYVTDRSGALQIWLQNQEGYLQQALVTEGDFGGSVSTIGSLSFSPDGRRLAFQRANSSGSSVLVSSVSGGSPVVLDLDSAAYHDAPTWSPDGEWIAYIAGNGQGAPALAKARVGGRGTQTILIKAGIPPFIARPQWSPDGRSILCETVDGLAMIAADGTGSRVIAETGWFAYAWDDDSRHVYGLRPTEDEHHFMLVAVDSRTGDQRVINANLGTIPQALQPIRGFSRLRGGGFLTSIARVKSDIYLMEGFRLLAPWWGRLWPFGQRG